MINLLPRDILGDWVTGKNARTCKHWHDTWCHKDMSINLSARLVDVSCDVKSLAKFVNLRELILGEYSEVHPSIKSLASLRTLVLDANIHVVDAKLCYLTNLTSLSLVGNKKISDLSIQHLTRLESLNIQGSALITDNSIITLTNMTALKINKCPKITLSSIQHLTKLTHLEFHHKKFRWDVLNSLPSLKILDVHNRLKLSHLSSLTILKFPFIKKSFDASGHTKYVHFFDFNQLIFVR